jgi:hypothetical protein
VATSPPARSTFLNEGASARTLYVPGSTEVKVYSPEPFGEGHPLFSRGLVDEGHNGIGPGGAGMVVDRAANSTLKGLGVTNGNARQ